MFKRFKDAVRSFFCNVMDWHSPGVNVVSCGILTDSCCKYCGKRITMDSQGNWYSY